MHSAMKSLRFGFLRRFVVFKLHFMRLISAGENSAPAKGINALAALIFGFISSFIKTVITFSIGLAKASASYITSLNEKSRREMAKQRDSSFTKSLSATVYDFKYGKRQRLLPMAFLCSVVIMIFSLSYFGMGLEVFVDGVSCGFVENKSDIEQIIKDVEQETAEYLGRPYNLNADITYSLSYIQRDRIIEPEQLKENLFGKVNELSMNYVLLLDGEIVGANSSKASLELLKQKVLDLKSPKVDGLESSFLQDITVEHRLVANSYVKTVEEIEAELMSSTKEVQMHSVQSGESLSEIADIYGISEKVLETLNPDVSENQMQVGSQIRVAATVPVVSVKSTRTITYEEPIAYDVEVQYDDSMYKTESKITQKGQVGTAQVTADVVYVNGEEVEKVETGRVTLEEPTLEIKVVGTKNPPAKAATGSFRWPITGTITSRYGYRWGSEFHTGLDIAKASGSKIAAADGGTVTLAGYNGNYGYCVIIDHGNGYTTLYAHCSKLLVSKGQKVAKGETISLVGSTGRSTGPHLHFEVRKNGSLVNPINYLP